MKPVYTYKAKIDRVIDGDTIDCTVDLGFSIFVKERFRLAGINTPELRSKDLVERELAQKAKMFAETFLKDLDCTLEVTQKDKYGRWLAKVWVGETCLNTELLESNHAIKYMV